MAWRNVKREVTSALRALGLRRGRGPGRGLRRDHRPDRPHPGGLRPRGPLPLREHLRRHGPRPSVQVRYIIDQAQGSIRKGDWFSDNALEQAQRRVFQMGVFGAVKVTTGTPDKANAIIPVVVDVREAPFHTIRYGGGIGIDPVRQEYRFIAEYTDRNFLGDLRRLTLRGEGGLGVPPRAVEHPAARLALRPLRRVRAAPLPRPRFQVGELGGRLQEPRAGLRLHRRARADGHRLAAAQQLPDLPLVQPRGGPHHRRHQRAHRERARSWPTAAT